MVERMPVDLALTRDQILAKARTLPASPRVMAELCQLLQDVNTDLDQIAGVIRVDQALASRMIRISNSVVYGSDWQVASIDDAVNRVGFEEVLRLVGTASVAGFVDKALAVYLLEAETVRASLLLHALASESVARYTSVDPRTAYTAGLLRATGMMVIDRAARERLPQSKVFDHNKFATYSEWEHLRFGLGSADANRMILDEWRFPDEIVTGIEEHLLDRDSAYENPLACVVNLAGSIVAGQQLAFPGEISHWTVTTEKLAAAGISEFQLEAAAEEAQQNFARQRSGL